MSAPGSFNSEYGLAFLQHTISNTALSLADIGFDPDDINQASSVTISITGNPIRFSTVAGATPTASVGNYVGVGSLVRVTGFDIQNLKLIRATGSDASAAITLNTL